MTAGPGVHLHHTSSEGDLTAIAAGVYIDKYIAESDPESPPLPPEALTNLPPVSPTFIPRRNITAEIHTALNAEGHTSALRQAAARAYGGFGKTVAAILYGHEYAKEYPGGRFFLSMEKADPITALASLGRFFNVPDEAKPEAAAAMVKAGLEGVPGADGVPPASLLILDNIVDADQWEALTKFKIPGSNEPLLPRGGCRLLITTRAESIPQAKTVRIVGLTKEEAREVYKRFCALADVRGGGGREAPSDTVADTITSLVGGLAVAVAAVAARMKLRPEITWADYAQKLATLPIESLPEAAEEVRREIGINGEALAEHRRTLRIIDDCLDSLPAPERRAIEYAALLPADMAPKPWLISLLEADAGLVKTKAEQLAEFRLAVEAAASAEGVDAEQLAQARKLLDEREEEIKAEEARTTRPPPIALTQDPDLPGSAAERVIQHLDTLDLLLEAGEGGKLLGLHRLWHARINERSAAAKVDSAPLWSAIAACAAGRQAEVVGVDGPGKPAAIDNPHCLTNAALRWELSPLMGVAVALSQAGRIKEAETVAWWLPGPLRLLGRLSEARAVLESLLKDPAAAQAALGDSDFASLLSNLATIQQAQGDLPGARASLERAIAIDQKHFAPDHPIFGIRYSNLAMIQQDQGDLPRARASLERAIAIQEKHFAQDHPTFATSYSNLATIQKAQGDLPGARASMERAIAINQKHFAPDHPNLATSYSNLALIQEDQGDLPGARASLERAIAIAEKHLGAEHPNLATMRSNLAGIQQDQGDLPGARASLTRAIAIKEKHFAPDHPTFATSSSNLALIQQAQGDLPGARASMERAIATWSKHLAADHPNFGSAYSNLAMIQQAQGDLPGARASMARAIAINQKHFAPDHPTFGISYTNLAAICYFEGDRAAACANLKKALAIFLKHFDEHHPQVKTVRESMAVAGCGG